jgi:hypothetical protein
VRVYGACLRAGRAWRIERRDLPVIPEEGVVDIDRVRGGVVDPGKPAKGIDARNERGSGPGQIDRRELAVDQYVALSGPPAEKSPAIPCVLFASALVKTEPGTSIEVKSNPASAIPGQPSASDSASDVSIARVLMLSFLR